MKICLVHDDFIQSGGAESLFATIASIYPQAPVYTSLVDWKKLPKSISKERVRTSYIQKIPFSKKLYKLLLPLYPIAFETFDLTNFDIVISSTTRFAKSVITKPETIHVCYTNSTPRFLWDEQAKKEYLPAIFYLLFKPIFSWLKRWDKAASSRVDYYISNSQNVKGRVKKYYNRDSDVIYPFADVNFYDIKKIHNWELRSQDYFLIVSRLVKWKKIEIAAKAAQSLGVNLKIVGTGPDEGRLKKLAKGDHVEFVGKVSREQLRDLYQNAKGLIVTQEEDFGISTVEAQACGTPVIAYDAGGQQEIIKDGKTGMFFKNQTEKDLKDAILHFSEVKWSREACRVNSLKFSQAIFEKTFKAKIKQYASQPE